MKKTAKIVLMGALFSAGVFIESHAAVPATITDNVPGTMNYQGRLVDPTGTPYVNGTYTFDIRLYTVANGGTPRWGGTYSAYVKDGYFNIMLGADGGQALTGTTFTHTDLWKALWPDASNGNPGDSLYLGVTPWQGANGALLGTKVELTPRQTLMSAPYAFRAQTADSANRANAGFDVTGTLTADTMNVGGSMVQSTATIVNIGGPDGNTASNAVNINALGVDIDSGTSDIYLNSGDRIDVNATGYYDLDAGYVQVDATTGTLDLESQNSYAYLKGNSGVYVSSSSGPISLNPQTSVIGYNQLTWNVPGTTQQYSPISYRRIAVTFPSGQTQVIAATGFLTSQLTLAIVGLDNVNSGVRDFYTYDNGTYWNICLTRDSVNTGTDTVYVHLLTFSNHWMTDYR